MRIPSLIVCGLAVGSIGLPAMAQDAPQGQKQPPARPAARSPQGQPQDQPPGGPRQPALSPEKLQGAWTLEATGVAKRVGASDEQVKAVVAMYIEARKAHDAASDKLRQELMEKARAQREAGGGDDGGRAGFNAEMFKPLQELDAKDSEKLRKDLMGTLSPDQAGKAAASLGSFNRQWDTMADAIAGFDLDAEKQQKALAAVEDFVIAIGKARGNNQDRDAMRSATQESRQKLTESMKKILSAEQFAKFEPAMRGGGRGGPGGPGGGGPDGQRRGGRGGDDKGGGGGG